MLAPCLGLIVVLALLPVQPLSHAAAPVPTTTRRPRVAAVTAPELLYYHHDATGSLAALTDSAGRVIWRADLRPFGAGSASPPDRPPRFLDQPRETDLSVTGGLYRLGARYYDPHLGRFISPDPLSVTALALEEPQRLNRYAYGLNNPYRYADPQGTDPVGVEKTDSLIGLPLDMRILEKHYDTPKYYTACNQFVTACVNELGGFLPADLASGLVDHMQKNWIEVTREAAIELASRGEVVVAGLKERGRSGHVAFVIGGYQTKANKRYPLVYGTSSGSAHSRGTRSVREVWGGAKADRVQYFVPRFWLDTGALRLRPSRASTGTSTTGVTGGP